MSQLSRAASFLTLLAIAAALGGCDRGHGVTYENTTGQTLTIFRFGTESFVLQPFESIDSLVLEFAGEMPTEAKDARGRVVFSESVTWEELKSRGWKVTIIDGELGDGRTSPTPTTANET